MEVAKNINYNTMLHVNSFHLYVVTQSTPSKLLIEAYIDQTRVNGG